MLRAVSLRNASTAARIAAQAGRANSTLASFATVDPKELSGAQPHTMQNLGASAAR